METKFPYICTLMDKRKRLRDILCACFIILMLPCGASIIRGMSSAVRSIYYTGHVQASLSASACPAAGYFLCL